MTEAENLAVNKTLFKNIEIVVILDGLTFVRDESLRFFCVITEKAQAMKGSRPCTGTPIKTTLPNRTCLRRGGKCCRPGEQV